MERKRLHKFLRLNLHPSLPSTRRNLASVYHTPLICRGLQCKDLNNVYAEFLSVINMARQVRLTFRTESIRFDKAALDLLSKYDLIDRSIRTTYSFYIKPKETLETLISLEGKAEQLSRLEQEHRKLEEEHQKIKQEHGELKEHYERLKKTEKEYQQLTQSYDVLKKTHQKLELDYEELKRKIPKA